MLNIIDLADKREKEIVGKILMSEDELKKQILWDFEIKTLKAIVEIKRLVDLATAIEEFNLAIPFLNQSANEIEKAREAVKDALPKWYN